jgi:HEAT repeat protein
MPETGLAERVELVGKRRPNDEETSGARKDLEIVQSAGLTSVEQLSDALRDTQQELGIRLIACSLLAWLGETSAVRALELALEEAEDDRLAWEAAKGLMRLRAQSSASTLVRVLSQGSPTKKYAAAYALGWLAVADTIPALLAAAMNEDLEDHVRGHGVEALGVMRAAQAVPELITLLTEKSPELRYWAAYSLGVIGDTRSIPALERMASEDVAVVGPPHNRSLKEEALDALEAIRENVSNGT